MKNREVLLEVENLSMGFESKDGILEVLKDVSFNIKEEEFLCLLGPNGCGKTTLLYIIAGFLKPSSGRVMIKGKNVESPGPDRPIITQDLGLFYWMNVWENAIFGLKLKNKENDEISKIANMWLTKLGLKGFEKYYPFELSGGMKQKLAIARVFLLESPFLILDEPFTTLDAETRERMQEEIGELAFYNKKTILFVTHSIDEAIFLADRVIVLTERPATIKEIIEINEKRPRKAEFRFSEKFLKLKEHIFHLLRREKEK